MPSDAATVARYRCGPEGVWTAPADGIYTLSLRALSGGGDYRIQTGIDQPTAGDRARDQRDAVVAWSADGAGPWSVPQRINDDSPWLDDWMPEVTVGADGDAWRVDLSPELECLAERVRKGVPR